MLWGNTAYCVKLSSEDLLRCSNQTESVGFTKISVLSLSYYERDATITNISQSLPHIMVGKQLA